MKIKKKIVCLCLAVIMFFLIVPSQMANAQYQVDTEIEIDVREFFRQIDNEMRMRELERQMYELARRAAEDATQYNLTRYNNARMIHNKYTALRLPGATMPNPNQALRNGSALAAAGFAMEIVDWNMVWNHTLNQLQANPDIVYQPQPLRIQQVIRTDTLDTWANDTIAGHITMNTVPQLIELGSYIADKGFWDMNAQGWRVIGDSIGNLFSGSVTSQPIPEGGYKLQMPELPAFDMFMLNQGAILHQGATFREVVIPNPSFQLRSLPTLGHAWPGPGVTASLRVSSTHNTDRYFYMLNGDVVRDAQFAPRNSITLRFYNEMRTVPANQGAWANVQYNMETSLNLRHPMDSRNKGLPAQGFNANPSQREDFLRDFWPNWDDQFRMNIPRFSSDDPNDTRDEVDKLLDWFQNLTIPREFTPDPTPENPTPEPEITTDRRQQTSSTVSERCQSCGQEKIRDDDEVLKCPICEPAPLPRPQPCPDCDITTDICTDPECPFHPEHPNNPDRPRPPDPPPPRPPRPPPITFAMFPFCIPWDVFNIVNTLAAPPLEPVFEAQPFSPMGVDWTFRLDFSLFDPVITVFRWAMRVGFVIGLAVITRKFIWTGGG